MSEGVVVVVTHILAKSLNMIPSVSICEPMRMTKATLGLLNSLEAVYTINVKVAKKLKAKPHDRSLVTV
jgi:hypothetical protein